MRRRGHARAEPIAVLCAHTTPEWFPLALGLCLASARQALSREPFDLRPRFVTTRTELERSLAPGGRNVLLCSNNIMTLAENLELSRHAKACDPRCVTIHGGPSTPAFAAACERFLREHPEVDFAVRGEGEITLVELLRAIEEGVAKRRPVAGVSALDGGTFRRSPDRPPIEDLDTIPSPYLTGLLDGLAIGEDACASVETNRGCPYACAFCSWSPVSRGRPRVFSRDRVRAEIEWLARRKVGVLVVADSNFGILERDVGIARSICEARLRHGAPQAIVVEYARAPAERLARIAGIFARSPITNSVPVSVQSRDPATLRAVGRSVSTRDFDRLEAALFRKRIGCTAFLMLGLPGSTASSFLDDLRYYFDKPIHLLIPRTIVLPNSPMAQPPFLARYRIRTDSAGFVTETATIAASEMRELRSTAALYAAVQNCGILRYFLCWLQWEKGIDALDVLRTLARDTRTPKRLPGLAGLLAESEADILAPHTAALSRLPGTRDGWDALHEAFASWVREELDVDDEAALDTLVRAQSAVMPVGPRSGISTERLPCDLVRWYRESKRGNRIVLRDCPPGTLRVQRAPPRGFQWEQESPLSRIRRAIVSIPPARPGSSSPPDRHPGPPTAAAPWRGSRASARSSGSRRTRRAGSPPRSGPRP